MGGGDCSVKKPDKHITYDLSWMDEKIPYLKKGNGIYKFCCFILGRRKEKLSFKEVYLILYGLNRKALGEEEAKKKSLQRILKIYKDLNNNNLPKGVE